MNQGFLAFQNFSVAPQVGDRGTRQSDLGWASENHSPVSAEASRYSPRGWPLKAEKLPCGLRVRPLWIAGASVAPGGRTHHTHGAGELGARELLFEEYGLWPVACWPCVARRVLCRVWFRKGLCPSLNCMWSEPWSHTGLGFVSDSASCHLARVHLSIFHGPAGVLGAGDR